MSYEEESVICPRCKCCEMIWQDCDQCDEDGYIDHDCGEDTCCCLNPEPNVICDYCNGEGGWLVCSCDKNGKHVDPDEKLKQKIDKAFLAQAGAFG